MNTRNIIIAIVVLVLIALGAYLAFWSGDSVDVDRNPTETTDQETNTDQETSTSTESLGMTVIGKSAGNRDINAYHFGNGDSEVLFVGGIHGGYSWNTSLVAYELIDYLESEPSAVPSNLKVTVIPVLNPDGLSKVVSVDGAFERSDVNTSQTLAVEGRFNGNNVDLNRNFDCDWQAVGKWQTRDVSGGTRAFSEPESQALKTYVEANNPTAAVVWYSSAGGVFASSCHNGVSAETRAIMNAYSKASGYRAYENFDFYEITGDAVNWLAKNNIPAISVLLTDHTNTEWTKNKAGIDALLSYYSDNQ